MASLKCFLITVTVVSAVALFLVPRTAHSIPFVVFHGNFLCAVLGISDKCRNRGVTHFTTLLSNWSGSQGYCIEIGNGAWDSWTMPSLNRQPLLVRRYYSFVRRVQFIVLEILSQTGCLQPTGEANEVISLAEELSNSVMEDLLSRIPLKLIELNFSGQSLRKLSSFLKILMETLFMLEVISVEHLAPASYIKIPTDIDAYRKGCKFLPKLNNEIYKNSTYKERFSSLENLVLIKFEKDDILVPKETSWFGYFPDGSWDTVLPAQETTLYTEDWIGLKTLDEAGKVKFVSVSGGHLEISYSEMKKYILPYLVENANVQARLSESSHSWSWSGHQTQTQTLKLYASH
ncbi:UNVERIFIED_CONTAM: Palmitoyl-protein thioesterase 1 [Sesamum calycinum]|uniref:Palmitoyl-protein thioesterase 1 n=1 Tax=Sesamum calycinum TaxID=2727403 RepID=A0AAW2SZ87_9LAMI